MPVNRNALIRYKTIDNCLRRINRRWTLEDLIEEYEAAGGENSFVHSLVQKEMYAWEKIERS